MYAYENDNQPSLLNLFGTVAVLIVVAVVGFMTVNTGDPLWFWPIFNEQPTRITVHCYGEAVVLEPGGKHFDELTEVFNTTLSGYKNWDSLNLSEETWKDYQTHAKMMTLVLSYGEPVRVHSIYKYYSTVDTLVVPLDARHDTTNAVFGLNNGVPASGALHVEESDILRRRYDHAAR